MGSSWSHPGQASPPSPMPSTNNVDEASNVAASISSPIQNTRDLTNTAAAGAGSKSPTTNIAQNPNNTAALAVATSPLLDDTIPAEIRNMIYRLILISDRSPVSVSKYGLYRRTALLRTCKRFRTEAEGLIFENDFCTSCTWDEGIITSNWLESLGDKTCLIKSLRIDFVPPYGAFEMCSAAEELMNSDEGEGMKDWQSWDMIVECAKGLAEDVEVLVSTLDTILKKGWMSPDVIVRERVDRVDSDDFLRLDMCQRFMSKWFFKLGTAEGDLRRADMSDDLALTLADLR